MDCQTLDSDAVCLKCVPIAGYAAAVNEACARLVGIVLAHPVGFLHYLYL